MRKMFRLRKEDSLSNALLPSAVEVAEETLALIEELQGYGRPHFFMSSAPGSHWVMHTELYTSVSGAEFTIKTSYATSDFSEMLKKHIDLVRKAVKNTVTGETK